MPIRIMLMCILSSITSYGAAVTGFTSVICPGHDLPCSEISESGSGGADTLTTTVSVGPFTGTFSGSTTTVSTIGAIGASTRITVDNFRPTPGSVEELMFPSAYANPGTRDTITLDGLIPERYNISVSFDLSGRFEQLHPWISSALTIAATACPPQFNVTCFASASARYRSTDPNFAARPLALELRGISGDQFWLGNYMIVTTSVALLSPAQALSLPNFVVTGTGAAEFGSTLRIGRLLITDEDGNPIPGLRISSESGFEYELDPANLAAAPVPEPATAALLGVCLVAAAFTGRGNSARMGRGSFVQVVTAILPVRSKPSLWRV